jgi:5-methylcytosine-specific restriction endonuclease McrA
VKRRKGLNRVSARKVAYSFELAQRRPQVLARANGLCEICRSVPLTEVHHRKRRSQGGTNDLANLLGLCEADHKRVHANPSVSYDKGWLLRRSDPETSWAGLDYGEQ